MHVPLVISQLQESHRKPLGLGYFYVAYIPSLLSQLSACRSTVSDYLPLKTFTISIPSTFFYLQ